MSRRSNRLVLLDSEHKQNILTTTNYANVSYDLLPYNMASATLTIENKCQNDVIVVLCIHAYGRPHFKPRSNSGKQESRRSPNNQRTLSSIGSICTASRRVLLMPGRSQVPRIRLSCGRASRLASRLGIGLLSMTGRGPETQQPSAAGRFQTDVQTIESA